MWKKFSLLVVLSTVGSCFCNEKESVKIKRILVTSLQERKLNLGKESGKMSIFVPGVDPLRLDPPSPKVALSQYSRARLLRDHFCPSDSL